MNGMNLSQYGLAGIVITILGGVISYVFKLLIDSKNAEIDRAYKERDIANSENDRLHNKIYDQQRSMVITLSDVARVMGDVQQMMRDREVEHRVEAELKRREDERDQQGRK